MNEITQRDPIHGRPFASAMLILCGALAFSAASAPAMERAAMPHKTGDFTGLSLQELYNLDVVQMNVLGAHTHPSGEFMFGYRYMFMKMEGIRSGGHEITPAEVFAQGFSVAHVKMEMQEQMFDAMYAPSDRLTLMAMISYKEMSMQHRTPANTTFIQHSSGVGDLQAMGMYTIFGDIRKGGHRLVLDAGISLPTGSINIKDHNRGDPAMPQVKLEYPMQTGSGTFDFLPGLTYLGDSGRWAWGAQTMETVRLGRNNSGYRLGNQYMLGCWGAYGLTDWLAPYLRVEGRTWDNITGRDKAYGAVPRSAEARPDRQAGERVNGFLGVDVYVPKGWLTGTRISVEGGCPIYEHLTGPQLGLSWTINVGLTYGF